MLDHMPSSAANMVVSHMQSHLGYINKEKKT